MKYLITVFLFLFGCGLSGGKTEYVETAELRCSTSLNLEIGGPLVVLYSGSQCARGRAPVDGETGQCLLGPNSSPCVTVLEPDPGTIDGTDPNLACSFSDGMRVEIGEDRTSADLILSGQRIPMDCSLLSR